MSAIGTKRTCRGTVVEVSFVPEADLATGSPA